MSFLAYTLLTYLIAAIPYSVLIGKLRFGVDIRQYGDGNPGATNVYRATGSRLWYIVAVIADALKGTVPVGFAYWVLGWQGLEIAPIGIAAICGHAFSPFLGFKGGKSVAITGGVWTAITIFELPIVIGLMLAYWYKSIRESDWVVVAMMLSVLLYLLLTRPNLPLLLLWLGNFIIVLFKHRRGLHHPPTFVRWLPFLQAA